MSQSVAVIGASGYAGGEVIRLIDAHPIFTISYLGAHTQAGRTLREVHPHLHGGDRVFGSVAIDDIPEVAVAFLALPHGASATVGAALAARGVKVVDIGSDFRMDTHARYEAAYGTAHPLPDELTKWQYGLPELFSEQITKTNRIGAAGCYPTSALLALVPLLKAGLVADEGIVINAMSGISGAGRALRDDLLFGSVNEGIRAYGVTTHRHRPEIEMALHQATGREIRAVFTPHLMPMHRGILANCTTRLASSTRKLRREDLLNAWREFYAEMPFVDVIEGQPQTRWVVGSNRALLTAYIDEPTGQAILLSVIDNLLKGAAGQAIQCANMMCGLAQETGLPLSGWMP